MSKKIIECKICHEERLHHAKGLCARCYSHTPSIANQQKEYRNRPEVKKKRQERWKEYYKKNKDKIMNYIKEYEIKNKDKINARHIGYERKRRRKLGIPEKKLKEGLCALCNSNTLLTHKGTCEKCYSREYNQEYNKKFAKHRKEWFREHNSKPDIKKKHREYSRKYYEKNQEEIISYSKEYQKNPKVRQRLKEIEKIRRSKPDYSIKAKARSLARKAVNEGKIKRQCCEICKNPEAVKHHPDYSKPLEIRWLCSRCHGKTWRKEIL